MSVPRYPNSAARGCAAEGPVAATSLPAASGAAAGHSSKRTPPGRHFVPVSSSLEICDLAQTVLDVIAALFWQFVAATGGLVVVLFYLVAQMIGAGKVIELLFGVNHVVAVAGIGC